MLFASGGDGSLRCTPATWGPGDPVLMKVSHLHLLLCFPASSLADEHIRLRGPVCCSVLSSPSAVACRWHRALSFPDSLDLLPRRALVVSERRLQEAQRHGRGVISELGGVLAEPSKGFVTVR